MKETQRTLIEVSNDMTTSDGMQSWLVVRVVLGRIESLREWRVTVVDVTYLERAVPGRRHYGSRLL